VVVVRVTHRVTTIARPGAAAGRVVTGAAEAGLALARQAVAAARTVGEPEMGLRRSFQYHYFGVPRGPIGWVGARMMQKMTSPSVDAQLAADLDLQPDDALLDVGCGSARLLADRAGHVRLVAGLDVSELQLGMARRRLADRIGQGTADLVLGDVAALPWPDGTFTAVVSLNVLKFVPDPQGALQEMCRVMRPAGRIVLTMGENTKQVETDPSASGTADAWGQWRWSDADAVRIMRAAGFDEVTTSTVGAWKFKLVRGVKPAVPA
jgi:SAM-dependent methyltransferase